MEVDTVGIIFENLQRKFDAETAMKEEIRTLTRQAEQLLRVLASQLAHVHSPGTSAKDLCRGVRDQFPKVREHLARIKALVPVEKLYKYNDLWRFSVQQACFVAIFVVYLEEGRLITLAELEGFLGVKVDAENEFHMEIEDFLHGVCSLCAELSRLAVNSVTAGRFDEPQRISRFVSELYSSFQLLNLKNDNLRKRFDAVKYDVKKIEEVVYDVSIRKLASAPLQPPQQQ